MQKKEYSKGCKENMNEGNIYLKPVMFIIIYFIFFFNIITTTLKRKGDSLFISQQNFKRSVMAKKRGD